MVVNPPTGPAARADGYAIRAATTSMDKPIITTVQQLGAAVQGIEAQLKGSLSVRSLQDHAADVDLYGRRSRSATPSAHPATAPQRGARGKS